MRKFGLFIKNGELINVTNAKNINEAVDFFSKIKNISKSNLLEIFRIKEI